MTRSPVVYLVAAWAVFSWESQIQKEIGAGSREVASVTDSLVGMKITFGALSTVRHSIRERIERRGAHIKLAGYRRNWAQTVREAQRDSVQINNKFSGSHELHILGVIESLSRALGAEIAYLRHCMSNCREADEDRLVLLLEADQVGWVGQSNAVAARQARLAQHAELVRKELNSYRFRSRGAWVLIGVLACLFLVAIVHPVMATIPTSPTSRIGINAPSSGTNVEMAGPIAKRIGQGSKPPRRFPPV